jgi:hypothetical protein
MKEYICKSPSQKERNEWLENALLLHDGSSQNFYPSMLNVYRGDAA